MAFCCRGEEASFGSRFPLVWRLVFSPWWPGVLLSRGLFLEALLQSFSEAFPRVLLGHTGGLDQRVLFPRGAFQEWPYRGDPYRGVLQKGVSTRDVSFARRGSP